MPTKETGTTRVCFTANTAWNLAHFRLNHIKAVQDLGIEVHAAAPPNHYADILQEEGVHFHPWVIERRSLNPLYELRSLHRLAKIYRKIKPDLVHHYTTKGLLYGTASARLCRVPAIVNAVTGLPHLIVSPKNSTRGRLARWAAMKWYGWSVSGARTHAMLQNNDDLRVLNGITKKSLQRVTLTGGSGVDLRRFRFTPPRDCDPPTVLFAGRLLREKGIFELVDAVRLLRRSGHPLRLVVCGGIDAGNRSSVSKEQCEAWISEGVVDTIERVDDIRPFLQAAQLVVLPSYREGTPRSLLEAMATGRPLIATDVPGCREVVEPDVNGVLVPPQDVRALADAINYMLDCPQRLDAMGRASRTIAEQKFDERSVIEANLDVYRSLLPDRIPPSCLTEERDVKPTTPRLDEPAGSSIGAAPLAR